MSDYIEFETKEEKRAFSIGYAKGRKATRRKSFRSSLRYVQILMWALAFINILWGASIIATRFNTLQ